VSKLHLQISTSVDGYVAGPNGEVNASSAIVESSIRNTGATIMGRNMFGGGPGPWPEDPPWNGWWGENPPFHTPVFVLTHHRREPFEMEGGTTFRFVTDGIESALEQATDAAAARDISLGGGADACRQYLAAGLVDEMTLNVAPVILGAGERLFEGISSPRPIERVEAVDGPGASHLRYRFGA
jgi:dihydrofolate reductase